MNVWLLLVLLAAAGAVWFLVRPPAVFVVRIWEGEPHAVHGTVTPAFLVFLRQLCGEHGLKSAEVRGIPRGRRIALWFTNGVSATFRQQVRNWWGMHGWPAPAKVTRHDGRFP